MTTNPMPPSHLSRRKRSPHQATAISAISRLIAECEKLGIDLESAIAPPETVLLRAIFAADEARQKLESIRALIAPY